MSYRVLIFNQRPLGQFSAADLLADIKKVHFSTLCCQYGLDPSQIKSALGHLSVEWSENEHVPYFVVRYQPENRAAIVVSNFNFDKVWDGYAAFEGGQHTLPAPVHDQLENTQEAFSVALEESQIRDFGLLLAYEIARWVAHRGSGLVFGLDGAWYRLNAHQAFIPMLV